MTIEATPQISRIFFHFVASIALLIFASAPTHAESRAEKCTLSEGPAQFYNEMTTCVTSVLQSQRRNRYGPEQFHNEQGAW